MAGNPLLARRDGVWQIARKSTRRTSLARGLHRANPVVVCGGGAAGLAASLSAAREGSPVCLLERTSQIGGTVTNVLIHTLGGFFDDQGELVNAGLAAEIVQRLQRADPSVGLRRMGKVWVLQTPPPLYGRVVQEWLREESGIEVLCRSQVTSIRREGTHVVEIEITHDGLRRRLRPRAIIDTTGCADIVRMIDPNLVEDDPNRAAGGLVVTLSGVRPGSLNFPRGAAVIRLLRDAAEQGRLPTDCRHAWLDLGTSAEEVYLKLFVPVSMEPTSAQPLAQEMEPTIRDVVKLLQDLAGFERARVTQIGSLGIRDGGRIRGEYQLQVDDVRSGKSFDDAACRGCWPIEYWHPSDGLSLEHLPEGTRYDIPLRALTLQGFENVWGAGKCLSADRLAHASARVVGTCWGMGEAVGRAAAAAGMKHEPHRLTLRYGRA